MSVRKLAVAVVVVGALGAGGYAAYRTQDQWVPHVFPGKPAAKSGGHDHGDHDDHAGHDHEARDDRVTLSEQAQKNLGLDVGRLAPQEYWRTIMIPGIVVDRPGESDRGVTSRVAGVVTAISARPGDTVRAGQPLFTLQLASEFLQGAQADLAKTAKEIEFAVAERERVANLVKQGTTPEAELIKQQNAVARLNTQLEAGRRQLQVFGLTPAQVDQVQQGKVVTEVTVVAPARGPQPAPDPKASAGTPPELLYELQELKASLGEQVQAGQPLATLSNHQSLLVEGHAFKSEADALAAAAEHRTPVRAEFSDEAAGAWPARGPLTVHHLSNQVDPAARTFSFYLPLDNQSRTFERDGKTFYVWRYRPGQRVRLRVPVEKLATFAPDGRTEVPPFVLPAGALVREGAEAYVFVQNGDTFIRRPVRVLHEDRRDAVLANDGSVTAADFVVKNQAAAINRALKAAAGGGGGHGHDHGHEH